MGRKLVLLALGAAAAAYVVSSRRRVRIGDPSGDGGSSERTEKVRRLVAEARQRLRTG
jgi:hypothetical protein